MSLHLYATIGEARAARKLVKAALDMGYTIDVNDGEETTVKRADRFKTITDAMCSTGMDRLTLRDDLGAIAGIFMLIYGNADDGSELIADHTDNELCDDLWHIASGEPVA